MWCLEYSGKILIRSDNHESLACDFGRWLNLILNRRNCPGADVDPDVLPEQGEAGMESRVDRCWVSNDLVKVGYGSGS